MDAESLLIKSVISWGTARDDLFARGWVLGDPLRAKISWRFQHPCRLRQPIRKQATITYGIVLGVGGKYWDKQG